MISFNAGLLRREVMYPWWVVEGLAVHFEVQPGVEPFTSASAERSPCAQYLRENRARLIPLRRFVTMVTPQKGGREEYLSMYSMGWGLYGMLHTRMAVPLYAFISAAGRMKAGPRSQGSMLASFEEAFGPVSEVQGAWESYLADL